jgi:hypothetical protein
VRAECGGDGCSRHEEHVGHPGGLSGMEARRIAARLG